MGSKLNTAITWFFEMPTTARVIIASAVAIAVLITVMALSPEEPPAPEPSAAEVLAQQRAEMNSELVMCVLGDDAPGLRDSLLLLFTKDAEGDAKALHNALSESYAALFLKYSMDPVLYEACVHDVARSDPEYRDSLMEQYARP